jgi:O-antigen/teichoic acid export membrane protein
MIVVLSALGSPLLPLLAATLVANGLLILPTAALTRRQISARLSMNPSAWPSLLRATVVFSLAVAVGTLYVYAAQLLTSLVATPHQSGLFAVSFRVFIVAAGLPGLVVGGALPLLSRAARDDRERLEYALGKLFDVSLIGGVGGALVLSAGAGFVVSVIAGPSYRGAAAVLEIQAWALVASSVLAVWSFALISLHMHRGLLLANAAALIVSLGLTMVLASSDGAQGAAIATLAGETTLAGGTLIALMLKHPEHAPSLVSVTRILCAAGLAALAAFVPSEPSVVRAIVAGVVYAAAVLLLGAVPQELLEVAPFRRRR